MAQKLTEEAWQAAQAPVLAALWDRPGYFTRSPVRHEHHKAVPEHLGTQSLP